jgi:hypothetical protein
MERKPEEEYRYRTVMLMYMRWGIGRKLEEQYRTVMYVYEVGNRTETGRRVSYEVGNRAEIGRRVL